MEHQILANNGGNGMNQMIKKLSHEEAIERARELVDTIRSRSKQGEELRHQPEENIKDFIESGLVRTLVPSRWGGHELNWKTLSNTAMEIAKGDSSAGWCYSLLLLHSWMLAFFPNKAQEDVWKNNPDACLATSINPSHDSQVQRVKGGYQLTGKWGFSSGINHCDWVLISTAAPVTEDGDEKKVLYFLVPKNDLKVIDVWRVIGMRGTGSNLLELTDVFVPEYRTMELEPWNLYGISPGMEQNTAPLYRIQLSAVMPVTLLSVILGATKGAYAFWRDSVIGKNRTRTGEPVASLTHQQIRLARVSAKIEAADALLHKSIELVESGRVLDYSERVRLRCNYAYCAEICSEVVETIYTKSGAAASAEGHPLQQYWRDIHAGSQHTAFNFDWVGEIFGKLELGQPVGVEY
jgi:3-hydroxy-9,10-secoandrosta-1,3,5(10)-triene-9,17-dione monooxygenase